MPNIVQRISGAYYNENDKFCVAWLKRLVRAGLIADGDVDPRSIEDVRTEELSRFRQCHFFAGIGGWSYALRLAGWEDDREVWTGSCPCQPFSAAGKRGGVADKRHLWPAFFHLIRQSQPRPVVVFGEQVASKDGLAWLDLVQDDLEAAGYAFGASDLCAAGVGAPHIRQRLYWMAHASDCNGWSGERGAQEGIGPGEQRRWGSSGSGNPVRLAHAQHAERGPLSLNREDGCDGQDGGRQEAHGEPGTRGQVCDVGDSSGERCGETRGEHSKRPKEWPRRSGIDGDVGHADDEGPQGRRLSGSVDGRDIGSQCATRETGPVNGFWRDAIWIPCTDGKARPVEPGTFPLAHGVPNRVGRLRGYGNSIVPQVAAEFVRAYREARGEVV